MTLRIITADVMAGLAQLEDESVHCVVTSPPYWGALSHYEIWRAQLAGLSACHCPLGR
jgi:DNA modification methylase